MAFQDDRIDAENSTVARRIMRPALAAMTALALVLAAAPAAAQDVPWGTPTKKKPAKKKKPVAKKPVAKKPLAKRPVAKKPVKRKPVAKKPVARKQAPAAKAVQAAKRAVPPTLVVPPLTEPPVKAEAEQPLTKQGLLDHFHKTLEPHGTWQKDKTFGEVWVPSEAAAGKNFAPYRSNGRWGLTKDGSWAWASKYKWGAIPFHYGRWVRTEKKRHAWIPGTDYAPAWVVWRTGDQARQFVGWAPMAPTHHWMNASPEETWNFVPTRNLFGPKVENFVIRDKQMASTMLSQSRILGRHSDAAGVHQGLLKPASPTLKEGNVPFYAAPKKRLSLADEAIAPITAETIRLANAPKVEAAPPPEAAPAKVAAPAPDVPEVIIDSVAPENDVRFATPPDAEPFATPPPAKRSKRARKMQRKRRLRARRRWRARRAHRRLVQRRAAKRRAAKRQLATPTKRRVGTKHEVPVYRCGWTKGPRRKWRCGPTATTPRFRRR